MPGRTSFANVIGFLSLAATLAYPGAARAQWVPANPVLSVQQQPDGALLRLQGGYLRFRVCTESIVRVTYSLEASVPEHTDFLVVKTEWPHAAFTLETTDPKRVTLSTARLKIVIERKGSAVEFLDAAGKTLAQERSE